jgi:hypothetical protein
MILVKALAVLIQETSWKDPEKQRLLIKRSAQSTRVVKIIKNSLVILLLYCLKHRK